MRRLPVFVAALALGCASSTPEEKPAVPVEQTAPPEPPAPIDAGTPEAAIPPLPATPVEPVVDTYHGVKVSDPYRWLENINDPKVRAWSEAQNAHARAILDKLPGRELLEQRIGALYRNRPSTIIGLVPRAGKFFALRMDPAVKLQPSLVVRDSLTDEHGQERVLLDLMQLDPSGHTAIDWFVPSPDRKYIALSLSQGGSESGTLHVYEVATGKETGDVIPRAQLGTGGGSLAWNADATGFWYTRYPREGERPKEDLDFFQQAYFHKLGTPDSQDTYAFGKELPRIAEIELASSTDGKHQMAVVQKGDGGEYQLWLRGAKGWIRIADFDDRVVDARFGADGAIWILSLKEAPRGQLLRLPNTATKLSQAKLVVPQAAKAKIEGFAATRDRLFVTLMEGGPSTLATYTLTGKPLQPVPTPAVSSVQALTRVESDQIFFAVVSYTQPFTGYLYTPKTGKLETTVVKSPALTDYGDIEVVREMVPSKDGTLIPLNILRKKGMKLDGSHPAFLTGYGGFDVAESPNYSDARQVWLEQGGIWAQANLRGGNEFGEDWHQAGRLLKKQNVFDDFLACAQWLVDHGDTSPKKLAIEGGSNGGLLMGAAMTQKPELFGAVVSFAGIYDMLRNETTTNGLFNAAEFGSTKDPDQFKALYAYSPYHRVVKGTAYPAVLFLTGMNDPRVDPLNSRKMIASLQAATSSGKPVLLRTSGNAGHGFGSALDEVIAEQVDMYSFLFDQLGVEVKPVWKK
jgi:prolyl oligopeptidase